MNTPNLTRAVTCQHCGLVNDYTKRPNGPHIEAICNGCDKHIKFLPISEPKLYVGRYKGVPIKDIEDLSYLRWAERTLDLSEYIRKCVQKRIQTLELTHR